MRCFLFDFPLVVVGNRRWVRFAKDLLHPVQVKGFRATKRVLHGALLSFPRALKSINTAVCSASPNHPSCPLFSGSAQSGADVLCIKHGGGKRCLIPGCQKLVRKNNRCTKHANALAPSSQPVSAAAKAKATKTTAAVAATTAVLTSSSTAAPVAPVAPPPIPRRRHEAPSRPKKQGSSPPLTAPPWSSSTEQRVGEATGAPSWPPNLGASRVGQDDTPSLSPNPLAGAESGGGGYAGGGSLPPVLAMAGDPSLAFGGSGGAGPPPGSFPLRRPPVASAFDGRVATGGGSPMPGGRTFGEGPDGVASNANGGVYIRNFEPRFRPLLPSPLSVDPRSSPRETLTSSGQSGGGSFQPPPDSCAAAHLLSLAGSLPRDLVPGGGSAGSATGGGKIDIIDDLANRPQEYLASGPPSSTQALRVDRTPPYPSTCFSEGVMERASASSPLPSSLLAQQPPPFATSGSPAATTTATTSSGTYDSSGGRSVQDWWDVGGRPAVSCDVRRDMPSNRPNMSSCVQGELTSSTTSLAHAPAAGVGVATPPSPAAVVEDSPGGGETNIAKGTVDNVISPMLGGEPCVRPGSVDAAARSVDMIRPTSATTMPQRSSCCGGRDKKSTSGGGSTASPGSTAPLPTTALATERSSGESSKARSCSTSPPLEQTATFISLSISGMMCMENCGQTVQRALREIPGVLSVTVHFPTRTASVNVRKRCGFVV